jgi:membrane protein implicated in regulation of membrane protease activity
MRRRWRSSEEIPARPYRDSVLLYGVLAAVIVLVAWATGGGVRRALTFAVFFFVVATAWSFWRWRDRIREHERDLRRREQWRAEQEARPTRGDPS